MLEERVAQQEELLNDANGKAQAANDALLEMEKRQLHAKSEALRLEVGIGSGFGIDFGFEIDIGFDIDIGIGIGIGIGIIIDIDNSMCAEYWSHLLRGTTW